MSLQLFNLLRVTTKLADYTAVSGDLVAMSASAAARTVTLPASPVADDTVGVLAINVAGGSVTVDRNGSTIEGLSANLTLGAQWTYVELVYTGSTWAVVVPGVHNHQSNAHGGTLDAAAIAAGTLATARLGSGSASSSTFLRGDSTWATPAPSSYPCDLRLTLETGVAYSSTDQTGKTTVYFTPAGGGNKIALYNGSTWDVIASAQVSLALGTLTSGKNYDVFAYNNAGTLTLEFSAAWTNDTTRADALTTQDGVTVKSGALTRRHVGTFRTTSTTATEDSGGGGTTQVGGKRFLWNRYNRVIRTASVIEAADTWSYTTDTWRVFNGATGPLNCCEFVTGDVDSYVVAQVVSTVSLISNSARAAKVAVGVNSTSAPSGIRVAAYNNSAANVAAVPHGSYAAPLRLGYTYLSCLEKGADGTCTFSGDNGGDGRQTGMVATLWG